MAFGREGEGTKRFFFDLHFLFPPCVFKQNPRFQGREGVRSNRNHLSPLFFLLSPPATRSPRGEGGSSILPFFFPASANLSLAFRGKKDRQRLLSPPLSSLSLTWVREAGQLAGLPIPPLLLFFFPPPSGPTRKKRDG